MTGGDDDGAGVNRRAAGPPTADVDHCPRCGSAAYSSGVCSSCGYVKRLTPGERAMRRRRARCPHADWTEVALRHVGDAYQRQDRCAGCGIERFVEVEA